MDFLAASRKALAANQVTQGKSENSENSEKYNKTIQEHANLKEQHERLKQQFAETVKALGDHSSQSDSQTSRVAQDFRQLSAKHAMLQEQLRQSNEVKAGLNEAVNALDLKCKSADEKVLLQTQLHSNRLRTIEATHNNIKERCSSLAVSAEQHKLLNVKLEAANSRFMADNARLLSTNATLESINARLDERHKSAVRDVEKLTELHSKVMQSNSDLKNEIRQLSSSAATLKVLKSETTSLKLDLNSKIESQAAETKRLQSKMQAANSLLKAHPIDPLQNAKTKNILASSAEILRLTHTNGSLESMHQCLGQVADVLSDLKGQLSSQHRLSQAWLDQLDKFGAI